MGKPRYRKPEEEVPWADVQGLHSGADAVDVYSSIDPDYRGAVPKGNGMTRDSVSSAGDLSRTMCGVHSVAYARPLESVLKDRRRLLHSDA